MEAQEKTDSLCKVFAVVCLHSTLITLATISLLVSLATLPTSYSILALFTTSCLCSNARWLYSILFSGSNAQEKGAGQRKSVAMDATMVTLMTVLVGVCTYAILYYPAPVQVLSQAGASGSSNDPLLEFFTKDENTNYYIGLLAAFVSGTSFSMS